VYGLDQANAPIGINVAPLLKLGSSLAIRSSVPMPLKSALLHYAEYASRCNRSQSSVTGQRVPVRSSFLVRRSQLLASRTLLQREKWSKVQIDDLLRSTEAILLTHAGTAVHELRLPGAKDYAKEFDRAVQNYLDLAQLSHATVRCGMA